MTLSGGNAVMLNENGQDEQLWQLVDPNSVDCSTDENNPPVAEFDGDFFGNSDYTLSVGETLVIPFARLLANDSDPDGDALTITEVEFIRNGNPVIVGNTVEFTGIDAGEGALFGYTISDGRGGTASANVGLNILDVPVEPITLDAGSIQPNGRPEPLAWGSCAEIAAFSASGTPTAVTLKNGRAGVKGNRFNPQLDYDPVSNTSEKVEINFSQFAGQVFFTLGNLEANEWQGADETGLWKLLDNNDNVLEQGIISPTTGNSLGSSVYEFATNYSGQSATKLVLEATAYDSGSGPDRTNNNSDYSIVALRYTPQQSNCTPTNARVKRQPSSVDLANSALSPDLQTTLFPNPAQESVTLTVESPTNSEREISVYDIRGVLKIKKTMSATVNFLKIPVEQLNSGLYFIHIQGATSTQRFIKK